MALSGDYGVRLNRDGTFFVTNEDENRDTPWDVEGDELDTWAADMEQRLAQYRSARRRVE